jgi:subtilisin family serine protease
VGSTDRFDSRSVFSCYGQHIDLVAPGTQILSTMWDDDYASRGGTSIATPHVVAVMGILIGSGHNYPVETLRSILRQTADDQVGPPSEDIPGWDTYFGSGRLNAARAAFWVSPINLYLPLIANNP